MTNAKLPGVHRTTRRNAAGKLVRYHRLGRGKGAKTFWKSTDDCREGSAQYIESYKAAIGFKPKSSGKFRDVISSYLSSPEFIGLKPRTQKDIRASIFGAGCIDEVFGDAPIEAMEDPRMRGKIIQWRNDNFSSNRTRDSRVAHLVAMMNWATNNGKLTKHNAHGIKRLYRSDRAGLTWTSSEIQSMLEDDVPVHVRRIIQAAHLTGLAPGDLVRVRLSEHLHPTPDGRRILLERSKTEEAQGVPVVGELTRLVDETPEGQDFLIVGQRGKPYSDGKYLAPAVLPYRRAKGVRDVLNLYDLRGTRATELLNMGLDLSEMALTMGWSIKTASEIVEYYARVDPRLTDAVGRKVSAQLLSAESEQRVEV